MRSFQKPRALVLLALLAAVTTGCQVKQEIWLNPDGSGKVTITNTLPLTASDKDVRSSFGSLVTSARNIVGWTDIKIAQDGKNKTLSATAYFKDFNAVQFSPSLQAKPTFKKEADGSVSMSMNFIREQPPAASAPKKPTPEEITAGVKQSMDSYKQQAGSRLADLAKSSYIITFHLPGPIQSNAGFKKLNDTTVVFDGDGTKAQAIVDRIMNDEAAVRKIIEDSGSVRAGPDNNAMIAIITQELFGVKGLLEAKTSAATKPLFDFAKESANAKPLSPELYMASGLYPKEMPKAQGITYTAIKQTQARAENATEVSFMWDATLPAGTKVIGITSDVLVVTDGDGKYLHPGGNVTGFSSQYGGSTYDDKKPLSIFLRMTRPASAKLKQVIGISQVASYSEAVTEELGTVDLKTGATLPKYGFKIANAQINSPAPNLSGMLTVQTTPMPEMGKIEFLDDMGNAIFSIGSVGNTTGSRDLLFNRREPLPEKAKVRVTTYKDFKLLDIPFEIKDVDVPAALPPASAPAATPPRP